MPCRGRLHEAQLLLGGESYNANTLPRFFILHAAVLPIVTMVLLLGMHIALIRLQGVTEFEFEDEEEKEEEHFSFFPDHMLTELDGALADGLLTFLATDLPATWDPKADPLTTPEVIKPEWFFYVAFRWLKLFSGTFAILSMGFIVFVDVRSGRSSTMVPQAHAKTLPRGERLDRHLRRAAIIGLTVWEALVAH